jgi:type II secretory pathway component PulK
MGTKGDKKGLVLVAVLWVIAVLMVIVAAVGQTSRLDTKVCRGVRTEQLRCKWSCRAGIEKAIAVLNEDKDLGTSDSLTDLWSDSDEDFNDILLERCSFNVRIVDEASKLNVNTATKEQLLGLWYMTEEIADAIIDWRDNDDSPETGGVEGGYYENMPFRYTIRNGPFRTIRELLLVKDVTPELLYGEDTNFNGQLDYNERDGDKSPPADDRDDELDEGWIAHLTCYSSGDNESGTGQTSGGTGQTSGGTGQTSGGTGHTSGGTGQTSGGTGQTSGDTGQTSGGTGQTPGGTGQTSGGTGQTSAKVNVNTASYIVLAALLGGGDEAERTAQSIIAYRATLADGIQNTSELVDEAVVGRNTLEQIQDYLTTSSNVFTIRCIATADRNGVSGATLLTEVVVDRSSTPCKILYWYQGANN